MSDKLNKDGFKPGQLLSQADQIKLEAQRREKSKPSAPKAPSSESKKS
ncbi:MAG: hypothetical protein ACPHUL_00020 [Marinomonas gallaica]